MKKILSILLFSLILVLTFYIFSSQHNKSPSGLVVLDPTLIESYPFEDSYKNVVRNYEIDHEGTDFTDGKIGRAIKFDGSQDYLSLNRAYLENEEDLTIFFWIYPSAKTREYQIILWEGREDGNGFGPWDEAQLSLDEKVEKIEFFMKGRGENLNLNSNISIGDWYHIALVLGDLDTSRSYSRLYIDGVLMDQDSINESLARNYTRATRIGMPGKSEHMLNAKIDEFQIYNTILTDSQIEEDFEKGVTCNLDKDCGGVANQYYCSEGSSCTNASFSVCVFPGKASHCELASNVSCTICEFGCEFGKCSKAAEVKVIKETPQPTEFTEVSFFKKMKCRIFHPLNKGNYQVCLNIN